MAPRMKLWSGLTLTGMAFVAVWFLPPSSLGRTHAETVGPEEARYTALSNDFRWTAEALRRHRWSDSLSALTVASAENGVAVALPPSARVDEDLAMRHSAVIRAGVDALPSRVPGVLFGYFHQPFTHAQTEDMPFSGRRRTETYVGSRDGVDYCLQVRVRGQNIVSGVVDEVEAASGMPPRIDRMGACRFFLQYGMAGPAIERWLADGGSGFAANTGVPPTATVDFIREIRLHEIFGQNVLLPGTRPIEADQCQAGEADACRALLLRPAMANPLGARDLEVVRRSPALSIGTAATIGVLVDDAGYLLSDLEAEFGPEAFERFWTSSEDFESAFEAAFGTTVGAWVVEWVDRVSGITPPSPALARSTSSASMLFVALLVGLAFVRNRKRSVV